MGIDNNMPEQKKLSIAAAIKAIDDGEMYLPALQRGFVWDDEQTERLFDSVMRGYPIGTFLFWDVDKQTINEQGYLLYEFIRDFDETNPYNKPAPRPFPPKMDEDKRVAKEPITVILDGQQRLTSFYMALQGSVTRKKPRSRRNAGNSFQRKELYFDLHSDGEANSMQETAYRFRYMTEDEARAANDRSDDSIWFKTKEILRYEKKSILADLVIPNGWQADNLAITNLELLRDLLIRTPVITGSVIETESMDQILDIFVRVNSGGVVLSKTDLIFSTVVSQWEDARERVQDLLRDINRVGNKYKFSSDFVLRTALYVLDVPSELLVRNLDSENIAKIQDNWSKIDGAIRDTVGFLQEWNLSDETIASYNSIMPLVYYRYHGGTFKGEAGLELFKYIVISQLKGLFGSASNTTLEKIRGALKEAVGKPFSMETVQRLTLTNHRHFRLDREDIAEMVQTETKGNRTFLMLSLLYPSIKMQTSDIHQDHLHPYASFNKSKIKGTLLPDGTEISAEKIADWQKKRNTVGNLQILPGKANVSKNDKPLVEWLGEDAERARSVQYLPEGISYDINNFDEFLEKRQQLLIDALTQTLATTSSDT